MAVYVDTEDLKATMGIQNTEFADDDLERAAVGASEIVEHICGDRTFAPGDAGEARYFTAQDHTIMRVDDVLEVTEVKVDRDNDGVYEEALAAGTDYRLGPPNAPAKGEPYTYIEAVNGTRLTTSGGYVKVTGTFGWESAPVGVVQAAMILASRLVRRSREAPFAIVLSGDMAAARIGRVDPEVRALLARYMIGPSIGSPRLG